MDLSQAIILGIIQGVTEWLPISSSGQSMIFMMNFFGIEPGRAFSISLFLHIGTLLAALLYFRKEILALHKNKELLRFLFLSTALTGIVGLPILFFFKNRFVAFSGEAVTMFIGLMLILTGLILKLKPKEQRKEFNLKDAVFAGAAQGIAIIPGISRSGTTIAALIIRDVEQELALRLSFMMSIPAVVGANIIEFSSEKASFEPIYIVGIAAAFLTGFLTMKYLIEVSKKVGFSNFCIFLGIIAFLIPFLAIGLF